MPLHSHAQEVDPTPLPINEDIEGAPVEEILSEPSTATVRTIFDQLLGLSKAEQEANLQAIINSSTPERTRAYQQLQQLLEQLEERAANPNAPVSESEAEFLQRYNNPDIADIKALLQQLDSPLVQQEIIKNTTPSTMQQMVHILSQKEPLTKESFATIQTENPDAPQTSNTDPLSTLDNTTKSLILRLLSWDTKESNAALDELFLLPYSNIQSNIDILEQLISFYQAEDKPQKVKHTKDILQRIDNQLSENQAFQHSSSLPANPANTEELQSLEELLGTTSSPESSAAIPLEAYAATTKTKSDDSQTLQTPATLPESRKDIRIKRGSGASFEEPQTSHPNLSISLNTTQKKDKDIPSFTHMDATMEKAYKALSAGQIEGAVALYKQVLRHNKQYKPALFGLAAAYHQNAQITESRTIYEVILKQDPKNKQALSNYLATLSEESPDEALKKLEILEEKAPGNSAIPAQIAIIYHQKQDPVKAARYLRKAISISPDNTTYRYNLALLLDQMGHRKQAISLYKQLVNASLRGETIPGSAVQINERLNYLRAQ